MAEYICRRCGGRLEVILGDTVCSCAYCGVTQTVPKFVVEQKTNMFARAERYLSTGDFDSAALIYERMLTEDFDDAELYWSLFLCRQGVSYVDDPVNGRRIPTINRVQNRSVLDSQDYKTALRYADDRQRAEYERQAAELEEIRRRILMLSAAESPYDIFICCKQDNGSGERTLDSVLAQNIYSRLTAEHYRVFFSRVTLEDKAGTAFEPYIYAAINSARVMLVVGTRQDYFNAPWVRNEWSRYLTLINSGADKMLIPLFREMEAGDIPAELSGFQAINMSRIGFMEDLLAAIRRQTSPVDAGVVVRITGDSCAEYIHNAGALIGRGDFAAADKLCEQALNLDPENAQAYLFKLLIENQVLQLSALSGVSGDISESINYRMAMRFGDDGLRAQLKDVNMKSLYRTACRLRDKAEDAEACTIAAKSFYALGGYMDSQQQYDECQRRAEELTARSVERKQEREYSFALDIMEDNNSELPELHKAYTVLKALDGYKDSSELAEKCGERINIVAAENFRLQTEHRQQEAARERDEKRRRNIIIIAATSVVLILLAAMICAAVIPAAVESSQKSRSYEEAAALLESGSYAEAAQLFAELEDYSDSEEQLTLTRYMQAVDLMENGSYAEAAELFAKLGNYKDSAEQCSSARYALAKSYLQSGEYDKAIAAYERLEGYSDSKTMLREASIAKAYWLAECGDYNAALELLESLPGYDDVEQAIFSIKKSKAESLIAEKQYEEGIALLKELSLSNDVKKYTYEYAHYCLDNMKYEKAIELFYWLGGYSDSNEMEVEAKYLYACYLEDVGVHDGAAERFDELDDYKDSEDRVLKNRYLLAEYYLDKGSYKIASELFAELGDYSDSAERCEEAKHQKFLHCKPGDTVFYGSYIQQYGNAATAEPLQWYVVAREENKVLLISKYVLDIDIYNTASADKVEWADSDIRYKLNSSFLNTAFTAEEQSKIAKTYIQSENTSSSDKIFLLSADEVEKYFEYLDHRLDGVNTAVSAKKYQELFGTSIWYVDWLLRDCIRNKVQYVTKISSVTEVSNRGREYHNYCGIRPAMWIVLE